MSDLEAELAAAGGAGAPPTATARLRGLLTDRLKHGAQELAQKRSGRQQPVLVAFGAADDRLLAALPAPAAFRVDRDAVNERTWLLVAGAVGALIELAADGAHGIAAAEADGGFLVVAVPARWTDQAALDELAPLAFEEQVDKVDRLRATAVAVPAAVFGDLDLRPPIGAAHPLRVAEAIARLGGRPADPDSVEQHEDAVLAVLGAESAATRPHEDPQPARRIARRILQRLDGMGKWGGYHTEFAHLARGFAGNDRALAQEVGEALLQSGLLAEKPSVGQRHVFLNPRRAGDIRALIDDGDVPRDLALP